MARYCAYPCKKGGSSAMKRLLVLVLFAAAVGSNIAAAYACNHDILCPTGWVWSDKEGSCVETARPTI